jgi:hypothetical protein
MKCKHGIKDCKNDGKEEICWVCNIKDFMGAPEYEPEKENANSGYPLLADVLAEIDERVSKRYGFYGWKSAVEEVLSKYFS